MKKNLFVGVDFIGDEEIRVNTDQKKVSKWDAFTNRVAGVLNAMMLLNKDIIHI